MIIQPNLIKTAQKQNAIFFWGTASIIIYAILAYYSTFSSQFNITEYVSIIALAFVSYFVLLYICIKKQLNPPLVLILFFTVIFQLFGIISTPQFEDDYFRYLWDGYIFFEEGNPYLNAPSHYFTDESIPSPYQSLLNQINYPDIKTIYSPLLQYSFWISHYFSPADITSLKIIYSMCNLGVILILAKMVETRYVLLYAWNPLLIKEISFTAHPDILGVFFLMLAVLFISTRPKTAAALLGVSVCSKPFAWLIAIYFLLRFTLAQWLIFFGVIVLLYFPFILSGNLLSGLTAFGNDWEFNAAVYSLFSSVLPSMISKGIVGLILLIILWKCYLSFRKNTPENIRGDIIIGSLLLLSPVINPWYLVWLLPFAAIHFSITPWIASFALLLSYFSGVNMSSSVLQAYELASWVKPVEYSIIFLALIYDIRTKMTNNTDKI